MFRVGLSLIVAQRAWQGFAGLITVLVIGLSLTHEQQGWYYTFLSLAALYSVFEMGLATALIQVAAYMFVKLHWLSGGRVAGEQATVFSAFLSRSVAIYLYLAAAFLLVSFCTGYYIFSHRVSDAISTAAWVWPWFFLVLLTAVNMLALPFMAVVEGSGEIAEVYRVRLMQGVLGAIACWFVLLSGGWLWAALMTPLAGVLVAAIWLVKKRTAMLKNLFTGVAGVYYDWGREVMPLQWRVGLNWVSLFLMSQLVTPILFYYQDAVVAGQIGLSLTIANMVAIVAQSWIAHRVPVLSQAAARQEWYILDQLFNKGFRRSLIIFFAGACMVLLIHYLLSQSAYISRVLAFWPFAGLLGFVLFTHVVSALSVQLRSFRREPLAWVSFAGAILTLPGVVYAAKHFPVGGVVSVMLAVQGFFVFPLSCWLWFRFNRNWRIEADGV